MNTSANFEKLKELVGINTACSILNELIAAEYERQNPDSDFEQRNQDWDNFCSIYTGSAADELITDDILDEYK